MEYTLEEGESVTGHIFIEDPIEAKKFLRAEGKSQSEIIVFTTPENGGGG